MNTTDHLFLLVVAFFIGGLTFAEWEAEEEGMGLGMAWFGVALSLVAAASYLFWRMNNL